VSVLGERAGFGGRGLGPRDFWGKGADAAISVDEATGVGKGRIGMSSPFTRGTPLGDTGVECD